MTRWAVYYVPFNDPAEHDHVYPIMRGIHVHTMVEDIEKHLKPNYSVNDLEISVTFHLTIGS